MKYQIVKIINEVNDFEEACILAGLSRQPAFDELPGELFWSNEKKIGVFAVPEPGDEEIAAESKDSPAMLNFFLGAMLAQPPLNDAQP